MAAAPKVADLKTRFEAAAASAKQAKTRPDNATLLKLYAYYKQATEGDAKGDRPGEDSISSAVRNSTRGRSSRAAARTTR